MGLKLLAFVFTLLFVNGAYALDITRDIPYTYDGQQTLDLFMPVQTSVPVSPRPAAIVIHGGGWMSGERSEIEYIAEWFAEQGFVVINVDYVLATPTENKWPAQFVDVVQGVWWLKENAVRYNINPDKILAVGASAGGHLAAMLGLRSVNKRSNDIDSEVHGIVSIAGPWDLLPATTEEQIYYVNMLLPDDTPEARYMASPRYLISRHSPPVLIFHGTDDELVPFQQSKYACEVYASKGLKHCFLIPLEGYTHSSELLDPAILSISIREFVNWWLTQ